MLIAVAALLGSSYFPLSPGLVWEYSVTIDNSAIRAKQVVKALPSAAILGANATPVQVWLDDKLDSTSYYNEANGFIRLIAQGEKELLPQPISVIPLDAKKGQKWEFNGQTKMFGQLAPCSTKTQVIGFVKSEVLGKELDVLKIEAKSKIGTGSRAMEMKTTEMYAKDVGLVYRRQELLGKRPGGATTVLVRFEGANR